MANALSSSNCTAPNVISFIHAHQADANTLGKQLQIPAAYILGLSGWETTWGDNRFAKEGNNFFSLHGNAEAPFATGFMKAAKPPHASLSTFPSFLASGQSFVAQYGAHLQGASTPLAFAQALIKSHFNSGNAATGGNSHFVENTQTGIYMVISRGKC